MGKTNISPQIKLNVPLMEAAFMDCADLKKKPMKLGLNQDVEAYLIYVEVAVKSSTSILGQTLRFLNEKSRQEILSCLNMLPRPDSNPVSWVSFSNLRSP